MVALATLSLKSAKNLFIGRQFGKQNMMHLLCLELTFAHKALVLIRDVKDCGLGLDVTQPRSCERLDLRKGILFIGIKKKKTLGGFLSL